MQFNMLLGKDTSLKASGSGVGENLLEKREKNNHRKTLRMEVFRQHPIITSKATSALLKT